MDSTVAHLKTTCILFLVLVALGEGRALANGDPASHVLPGEDLFLGFDPQVCSPVGRRLSGTIAASRRAGYPVKVAVISAPGELGTIPRLFNRPQAYARVLGRDLGITLRRRGRQEQDYRLLIVMPDGFGLYNAPSEESRALERLPTPRDVVDEALAREAIATVTRLARVTGTPLKRARPSARCSQDEPGSSSGSSSVVMFIAPAALLGLALLVIKLGRRQPPDGGSQAGAGPG